MASFCFLSCSSLITRLYEVEVVPIRRSSFPVGATLAVALGAARLKDCPMLINFPYIKRDSPVHRLDPRTKILLLFAFIFVITQSSNFWFVLAGFVAAIFYYGQAHLTWSETKTAWFYIIVLALVLIVTNYFITAGAVVQGLDLSHQHIIYSLPFFSLTNKVPFIGPGKLVFSVDSITFMLTQIMRNISIGLFVVPVTYTIDPHTWELPLREWASLIKLLTPSTSHCVFCPASHEISRPPMMHNAPAASRSTSYVAVYSVRLHAWRQ